MMQKNVEIRAEGENVANEMQESKLEDEAGCMDGVRVGEEVSQALCTCFFKTNQQRLRKPKI